ncbi:hypothetical protein LSTR_LSTR012152 [Laodelphax striatellus]|uniref:C2H2-type domain-containing protein n=1 Tax=Laodelphax striatellus TaxID=195883 RepID=A0A482X2F0_LAOST|nr:hypothetical protein LSTR_LSTR012152 [Laodelphax striatellus]
MELKKGSNLESESSQLQLIGGPASDGETKGPVESDAIDVGHSVFGSSHPDILKNDDGFYYCRYCKGCRSPILKEIIRHESTHLAPPTLCPFEKCGKTFSRKEHMHRHYLSHTGVRPYQCSVCEKRFIRKDHMVKHERRKHLPKRLQCRFCIHTFIDKKSLATHEEIIHENKRKVIKIEVEIKKENNNSNQFPEDISNVESSS